MKKVLKERPKAVAEGSKTQQQMKKERRDQRNFTSEEAKRLFTTFSGHACLALLKGKL